MKKNKYTAYSEPGAIIDFHRLGVLTEADVVQSLDAFLTKYSGRLLIITGKGLHSMNGPKVKAWVVKLLKNHPRVDRFRDARRDRGGEGAIEVWTI